MTVLRFHLKSGGTRYALRVKQGYKLDHVIFNEPGVPVRVKRMPKGEGVPHGGKKEYGTLLRILSRNRRRYGATKEAALSV